MENIAKDVMRGIAEGAIGCLTGKEPVVAETASHAVPVAEICFVATLLVVFALAVYKCRKK